MFFKHKEIRSKNEIIYFNVNIIYCVVNNYKSLGPVFVQYTCVTTKKELLVVGNNLV